MKCIRLIHIVLLICFAITTQSNAANEEPQTDELTRSTWSVPTHEEVQDQVETWLEEVALPEETAKSIREMWKEPVDQTMRLSVLADSFAMANESARDLVDLSRSLKTSPTLPPFEFLESSEASPFLRDNLRLIYGRWLAQNELYNETLERIEDLEPDAVVDPAALLFYQSVAQHRLMNKEKCLPILERLLEQEKSLPRRFRTLAKLIQADLEPLEADSLDEVSRLMDNIKVRLGHGRAGKRVRKEEDDVIAKLDKMIEDLEKQQQQAQAAAAASGKAGDAANPAKPMQDSMPGGVRGPGNVDAKELAKKGEWGNLPPKERQQALQQLGEDFPSHYRDVIVEYFRKIAREQSK